MWRTDWIKKKSNIAMCLQKGGCGGSYGEAFIVLCAAMSALAAEVWPGEKKDRKRFIELLTTFAPDCLGTLNISIPLLVEFLKNGEGQSERNALKTAFLNDNQYAILTGEVDKSENDVLQICPCLNRKVIRSFSYAAQLYNIRCSYAHEYAPAPKAESWNMGAQRSKTGVTYVNTSSNAIYTRDIFFDIQWIGDIAIAVASAIENNGTTVRRDDPERWWVEG